MTDVGYTVGKYGQTDFDGFAILYIGESRLSGRLLSREDVIKILERPGFSPEEDLFTAKVSGNIVGYAQIIPEAAINRVRLRSWVSPEHRRKGIATSFTDHIVRRAEELGIKSIQVGISRDNRIARTALPRLGFKYIYRYLEMELDVETIPAQDAEKALREFRHLQPGEEIKLAELQNRIFSGHRGYVPYTPETMVYDINLNNRSTHDVILACEKDLIIGCCWTGIIETAGISGTENKGMINMMGIEPEYRGRGLGRKVLLAGLAYLRNNVVKVVSLDVGSENKAAYELYRSVGFRETGSTLWYEKLINQDTGMQ